MKRTLWALALVAAAVATGLLFSRQPWQDVRGQQAQAKAARAEMRKVEAERAELLRQRAAASGPVGREELARERGYRKPGEVPLEAGVGP